MTCLWERGEKSERRDFDYPCIMYFCMRFLFHCPLCLLGVVGQRCSGWSWALGAVVVVWAFCFGWCLWLFPSWPEWFLGTLGSSMVTLYRCDSCFWVQLERRGAISEVLWDPAVRQHFSSCVSHQQWLHFTQWRAGRVSPATCSGVFSLECSPGHQKCSGDFVNLSEHPSGV